MKIATYNDESRDGQLVVVSRDLTMAHYAAGVAGRLQQVLDDWNFLSPQLEEISQNLNHGKARHAFAFDPRQCLAPLPRAFYFASPDLDNESSDGAHAMRVRRSDRLLAACDPVPIYGRSQLDSDDPFQFNLAAQLTVITGDLGAAAAADDSLAAVRLVTTSALWFSAAEAAMRDDAVIASFAPVAVTPDELGARWHDGLLDRLQLSIQVNGKRVASDNIAPSHARAIGSCLADCAALRGLRAGSLVGIGGHRATGLSAASGDLLRVAWAAADDDRTFGAIAATLEIRR
ncbi:MAG: fumarylacetoacetate hydrolase [Ideonella sp.]